MKKVKVKARAKINLFLEVRGKRTDGYHEVETVLQNVALCDELKFAPSRELEVVYHNGPPVPAEKDLVLKAAALLKKEAGAKDGARITLQKSIPVASGLGGASADAAACLLGLSAFWQLDFLSPMLFDLASQLGADVPFFLTGGTALGRGRGERLQAVTSLPFCYVVVAKPAVDVSTAEAYTRIDTLNWESRDSSLLIGALEAGDLRGAGRRLYNIFETVMEEWHPEVLALKGSALKEGALGALMTGSGSAVFALADKKELAERIGSRLKTSCPFVVVTTTYPRGLDLES